MTRLSTTPSRLQRSAAAAATFGVATATFSGTFLTIAAPAEAAAAPDQPVENDWGQSAAEVQVEISAVVDDDVRVVATRTRYLRALSAYATAKISQRAAVARYKAALLTRSRTDDALRRRQLAAIQTLVYRSATEVVLSQLAYAKATAAAEARVRATHYIKAPYVAPPAQPSGLVAVGATGQVDLSWSDVVGATSYRVFRDGMPVASTELLAYSDTGLENGTAYEYTVMALNVAGWSPVSNAVVGTPTVQPPSTPTGLTATPGDATMHLTWNAAARATSYRVYRGPTLVATVTGTTYDDISLSNGTGYSWTVVALNGSVASPASAAVSSTPVATAPSAPTGLVASAGDGRVVLSWTAPTGATSYRVYRNGASIGTSVTTGFTDSTASNGTTYTYTVVAYRANSLASAASTATTATPQATPLATPVGLAAQPGDGQVVLTWGSVAGANSYRVYRDGTLVGSPVGTTFTDLTASNGTTYSYTVVAVGTSATSAPSGAVTATPNPPAAGAPTGLSGQAGDRTAVLSWNSVVGATSYYVYRDGLFLGASPTTAYTDVNLTNGTPYTYHVTAIKAGIESAASTTVQVTPFVVTPAVPAGLTATPGSTQVALTWNQAANAQSYKILRNGTQVGTSATTAFTDTGLVNGTAYTWTVVSVNGSASSVASAGVTSTPMAPAPGAPTGLSATPGNATVALSWTAVASATSYRVYRNSTLVASPTGTSVTDTGLTNGTVYSYYVVAVTDTTPGAASVTVTATPTKPLVNGTFTGATASIASGHGTLRVVIVVVNSKITTATGTLLTNDGSETVKINNTAMPQYNSKAVVANSANITKVSQATLTWTAYKTSLQSAITLAGL